MQTNSKWFTYLAFIAFMAILISYTLFNKSQYSTNPISLTVKEEVVYKESDVLSLLKKFQKMNKVTPNKFDEVEKEFIKENKNNEAIESKKKSHIDYLAKYPKFMDCTDPSYKKWSAETAKTQTSKPDYSLPAPENMYDAQFTRAVLLYFPIELKDNFYLEFKWLYRSWIEMQKNEPKKWRTDLVIFIENDKEWFKQNPFLEELNCKFTNVRKSKADKPMCTLIHYVALKKRDVGTVKPIDHSQAKMEYNKLLSEVDIFDDAAENLRPFYARSKEALASYGYVDSILMAFDGYQYFKSAGYDFLIRSDMDVFLTPLFSKWLPNNCNDFYVGRGGYSDDFNRKRLSRVAEDLGLEHAGESNLGSTWYSTPEQFRLVSYLTIFSMTYISKEEFTQAERQGKMGVENWPYWHYGVLLLYGQNVGLNHLIGSKQLNVVKLENLLDFPSANDEPVDKKLHIHVFHGDNLFSKFAFKVGKYDNMTVEDNDLKKVKFYCLKMALDAKNTNNADLKIQLDSQIAAKV